MLHSSLFGVWVSFVVDSQRTGADVRGEGMQCDARLMVSRTGDEYGNGLSRARGFPFVRIELQQCGLVWQRCVPTEVQRLTWLAAAEFASAQSDRFVTLVQLVSQTEFPMCALISGGIRSTLRWPLFAWRQWRVRRAWARSQLTSLHITLGRG